MIRSQTLLPPLLWLLSLLIVAFGQPAGIPWACPIAATVGFALFFISLKEKHRFLQATLWFTTVQLIQLSWMSSIEFQGIYILFVYTILSLLLGVQFALFVLSAGQNRGNLLGILALSSLWTLFEWSRLFFLCGFSLNPIGLSLTATTYGLQSASFFGIFGLSFWVMFTNLYALKLFSETKTRKKIIQTLGIALSPYLLGALFFHFSPIKEGPIKKIALIETALLPSQKIPMSHRMEEFISPLEQWKKILDALANTGHTSFDVIVLPEVSVPFLADWPVYPHEDAIALFPDTLSPPLLFPFADSHFKKGKCVSNLFFAQALANRFNAEVVIGLDHLERSDNKSYNSAFHLKPHGQSPSRYDKQILLPLAEYLPFSFLKPLTKSYGIYDFFQPGKESKVFEGQFPFTPCICYEETFPSLMRQGRKKGAELFINLTNDNYFPHSTLALQHYFHAKVRAAENGIPMLRACNGGITAVIDSFGRESMRLKETEGTTQVLAYDLPLNSHPTPYLLWGDLGILCLSLLFLALNLTRRPLVEGICFKSPAIL